MKKYTVEFIGTFFLVFTVGCAVAGSPDSAKLWAPLAIGCALAALVFAGGHISGAHYNPAVTLAAFIRGKCTASDVPGYIVAQCAGAALAAMVVPFVKNNPPLVPLELSPMRALVAEFVFTFALVYVVLNVATAKGTQGNSFYGLAIGLIVFAGASTVGGISGAAFNPAVAIGATMMGLLDAGNMWIYLVANFAAAAAAAITFKAVNPADA